MARPVNGKPRWLVERFKELPKDGVPEFVGTYLRMKYGQKDIDRIMAGYECKRRPVLWVNEALGSVDEAKALLAEVGAECVSCDWQRAVLAVPEGAESELSRSELVEQGKARVLDDAVSLLAADAAVRFAREIASKRRSERGQESPCPAEGAEGAIGSEASQPESPAPEAEGFAYACRADTKPASAEAPEEPVPPCVTVAELCAGTGGMTLPLATALGETALIRACEVAGNECSELSRAVELGGVGNVEVRRCDSRRFKGDEEKFDVVLLDPPCSPTGTLYAHDPRLHATFGEQKIPECMALDKSLFLLSLSLLEVGGVLVYTTSSVLNLENEEVIRTCLARSGSMGSFEVVPIELPAEAGLPQLPTDIEGTVLTCPSERCEGRFVAAIRRVA